MTIAVGATRLIQQASWPAPETMLRCDVAEPLGGVADRLDATLVERDRVEMADLLDLDFDAERLADRRRCPSRMRPSIASSVSLSGERMSMVKTVRARR